MPKLPKPSPSSLKKRRLRDRADLADQELRLSRGGEYQVKDQIKIFREHIFVFGSHESLLIGFHKGEIQESTGDSSDQIHMVFPELGDSMSLSPAHLDAYCRGDRYLLVKALEACLRYITGSTLHSESREEVFSPTYPLTMIINRLNLTIMDYFADESTYESLLLALIKVLYYQKGGLEGFNIDAKTESLEDLPTFLAEMDEFRNTLANKYTRRPASTAAAIMLLLDIQRG